MVLPIAIILILLARFILEGSLNRQEVAVFARGSANTAASLGATNPFACTFDRQDFTGRADVGQIEAVRCSRRDAERGLSRERPIWDAAERAADPWPEILRDVRPRSGPRDIVATADARVTFDRPGFLEQQGPTASEQSYLAPEAVLWAHSEERLDEGHDLVIWDELCKAPVVWLFPNVFPNARGPRC